MILAALKQFDRALLYFEVCVTMPANAVSHIMMEAHKKYLLVSLIHQGHKPREAMNLPKYTSSVVNKYFKQLSAHYIELVTAYYTNNPQEMTTVANKHKETFEKDQNWGLVQQVVASQTKTNIKRLTKTFLTLSMSELANRVGLSTSAEAERLLVEMIEEGSIHARISQKDGMVRFDAHPEDRFNSVSVLRVLEGHINKCISLDQQIVSMDEEIVLNPTFIKKSSTAQGGASGASSSQGSQGASNSSDGAVDGKGGGGGGATNNGFGAIGIGNSVVSASSDRNALPY